ncbi:hypothetical protein [Rubinisphaera italica]|uniref:Uncharacterized protein n=1 Tax=Rubinisphaera italica TaxID=2527969 RepID=A0A5C5XJM1_9PLAN|nr:hypothetical protein [Rubinisphaera italica]TWT63170.1 hypothetical protein Pan54_39230 [Rubinisphaera italica]
MCECNDDYRPTPLEEMDYENETIIDKKREHLRQNGWKWSCSNPCSFWMWEKEINGRLYVVGQSTAFDFQNQEDQLKLEETQP